LQQDGAMADPLKPTIHARGQASRLDAVLELVAFTAKPRPLSVCLDELPPRIAKVLLSDVCSLYLLEDEDLVLRGNVGFPRETLGEVRMAVGEGITGLAVEYMRPITLAASPTHERYRHFPGTGEERFPVFMAVPIPGPHGVLGALVAQKRALPAFTGEELELAAALTAPIAAVVERARLARALHAGGTRPASASGQRRITLPGRTAVAGRALGAVHPLPRPEARPSEAVREPLSKMREALERALAEAKRALQSAERNAGDVSKADLEHLAAVKTVLEDARLSERTLELAERGKGLSYALTEVGAEALKTASLAGGEYGVTRARLIADIAEALSVLVSKDVRLDLPKGAVLVGDHFTAFDLLVSMRSQPAGVVLSRSLTSPFSRQVLSLIHVPTVVEVAGLLRWLKVGEIALVDGDHGMVRLNPSRAEIALVRHEKKRSDALSS
jgi:phosphotransferase system enzyme I (PtsP)